MHQGAENVASAARFNLTKLVGESVIVDRELGFSHTLLIDAVVPDDIGYSGLVGRPVRILVSGDNDLTTLTEIDRRHGVTEGVSVGMISLSKEGIRVTAYARNEAVQAMACVVHRCLGSGVPLCLEVRYASISIKRRGRPKPSDLRRSSDRRAALLGFSLDGWASFEEG